MCLPLVRIKLSSSQPCFGFLDKVDNSLGKRVMLELFLDVVPYVTLRFANVGKFKLVTQTIDHQFGTLQVILHDIIELH